MIKVILATHRKNNKEDDQLQKALEKKVFSMIDEIDDEFEAYDVVIVGQRTGDKMSK